MLLRRALGALLLAGILVAGVPARAESGEFPRLLVGLREGFLARDPAEPGTDAECRRSAAVALLRIALDPALVDTRLAAVDPASRMADVAVARGRTLAAFDVVDLAQFYAEAGGDSKRFVQALRAGARPRRISLDWTSPPVVKAMSRVHKRLQALEAVNFNVTWSGRYEGDGWLVDTRAAWYPLEGRVHMFLVGSANCSTGVKSAILNLSGPVRFADVDGVPRRVARLDGTTFEVRCCETRLSGEWTDQPRGTLVSSQFSLKVLGRQAEGRMVQTVRGETSPGQALRGRLVYLLEGRLLEGGLLQGTFQVTGDREVLRRFLGRSGDGAAGTWTGRLGDREAQGTLTVEGGPELPWRARVVEPRAAGS